MAIDASELFPRVTTWLGFPRDMVLRGYMVDFVHLFAPHYSPRLIRDAARAQTQEEVDELLKRDPAAAQGRLRAGTGRNSGANAAATGRRD